MNNYYSWESLSLQDKINAADIMGKELIKLSPIPTGLKAKLSRDFPVKAVLFDIYGTLLVSGSGDISLAQERENHFSLEKALDLADISLAILDGELSKRLTKEIKSFHALQKEKGADYPEVDIIYIWHRVLKSLEDEALLEGEITTHALALLSAYHEIISNPVWEMPGARSLLPALRDKGMPLGIISNAQYYTPLTLEKIAGVSLNEIGFSHDLCSWSYQLLRGKPSRVLFEAPLKILSDRGISANEVLYVGNDMLNDIYTAHEWGCRTALFAGDQRSLRLREEDDRCGSLKPDLIITDLNQLKDIL